MNVYIPFNSNDFNSVFTTLSISPIAYYPKRNYSFKRASATFLNENENFLVGFEKPIFHIKELDKDYGFPILLEIDIDSKKYELVENKDINYFIINSTIYLFKPFKLIFRREKELQETLAKSLKSIETKYAKIAKDNSVIIKEDCFISDIPKVDLPASNKELSPSTFFNERRLNKIFGVILGSSIAFSNKTSKELQEILLLMKTLNNNISLFLNKIGSENRFEKEQIFGILSTIKSTYESTETLDESIMLESSINSDTLNLFKNYKIFNIPVYELILEGILNIPRIDLPILLKLEKFQRIINSKFNSKYPSNYIKKVNDAYTDIKRSIDRQVTISKMDNKLKLEDVIKPKFIGDKLVIDVPENLSLLEDELLKSTLLYFIEIDKIDNVEQFFINRKDILIDLAKHFKINIKGFDESEERRYLLELLKSFDSLRSGFKISSTNNNVLKSLAILFTSGRDFLKFVENNEKEGVENSIIYYSLWGSIYGAAILPKTTTETITDDSENLKTLVTAFDKALSLYKPTQIINSQEENPQPVSKKKRQKEINNSAVSEPSDIYSKPVSVLATKVLEIIQEKKKAKISDLKSISKSFKKNSDVEELILEELKETVSFKKEGRTMYAISKDNNKELFE